jgi:hypothetical protein
VLKVNDYVKGWRARLTKRVEDGRQLLREVLALRAEPHIARLVLLRLVGPLHVHPVSRSDDLARPQKRHTHDRVSDD